MSPWANVAAGLLGGAGQGLENVAQSRAKAEIEEAKELRARAFKMELYDKQRGHQVEDRDDERSYQAGLLEDDRAYQAETADRAFEMQRELKTLDWGIGDRVVEEATNDGVFNVLLDKQGNELGRWAANKENINDKDGSKVTAAQYNEELKFYQKMQPVLKDLENQKTTLTRELNASTEDGAAAINSRIAEIEGKIQETNTRILDVAPNIAQMFNLGDARREQEQSEAKIKAAASAAGISVEEYKRVADGNTNDPMKIMELAELAYNEDEKTLIALDIWEQVNPQLYNQIQEYINKLENNTHWEEDDPVEPDASQPAQPTGLPQGEAPSSPINMDAPGIQRERSPLVDLAGNTSDNLARRTRDYFNDPQHIKEEIERLENLLERETGPSRNRIIRQIANAKRKLQQATGE